MLMKLCRFFTVKSHKSSWQLTLNMSEVFLITLWSDVIKDLDKIPTWSYDQFGFLLLTHNNHPSQTRPSWEVSRRVWLVQSGYRLRMPTGWVQEALSYASTAVVLVTSGTRQRRYPDVRPQTVQHHRWQGVQVFLQGDKNLYSQIQITQ